MLSQPPMVCGRASTKRTFDPSAHAGDAAKAVSLVFRPGGRSKKVRGIDPPARVVV
jgi:hypothetical protein